MVHLTTECDSKANSIDAPAPPFPVSQLVAWSLIFIFQSFFFFFFKLKDFLEILLKIFKHMAGLCFAFSLQVIFTKLLSGNWKHLLNSDSSPSSPAALHFAFPPTGLLCMLCDVYPPLPPCSTPSVVPRGQGPVVALWRGWEKSLEPLSKEKKSPALGGGGSTWS